MKKFISILLSLSIFCSAVLAGFTANANTMDTAAVLLLGQQANVTVSSEIGKTVKQWFRFECYQSGYYELYSSNYAVTDGNIYVTVYDANKNVVDFYANPNLNTSFSFASYLNSGVVYYYLVETDGSACALSLSIKSHIHTFSAAQAIAAVADDDATLREDGGVRYNCTGCGYYYFSEAYYYPQSLVISTEKQFYDGNEKTPAVTVYDRLGNVISPYEYAVSYEKNVNPGKAYVTVTFTSSRYSGELSKSFFIYPKKMKVLSLTSSSPTKMTLKWEKDTTVTGYEIKYSTSKKFYKSKTKTVTVAKNSASSKAITGLVKNKKYYVRVRAYKVYKNTYKYGAWSDVMSVKTKK